MERSSLPKSSARPVRAGVALTLLLTTTVWLGSGATAQQPPERTPEYGPKGGVAAAAVATTPGLSTAYGTPGDAAAALVGSGVTISNVTYQGSANAIGTFSGGEAVVGFDQGIILSSGDIANVVGPNTSDSITGDNGEPGDADLSALTGQESYDAAVLEFDFVPDAATVFFQYVFASDEYNEYVNSSYDDVFAFFVNGANCATVNGARVSINTINNGNPFNTDPRSQPGLYRNNDLEDGGGVINTEMDGLTVVLTCTSTVTPNVSNHMKLAIADSSDSILDSDVFIQATSLTTAIHDFKQDKNADGTLVPWANDHLYNDGDCGTMRSFGCAITAMTDVLRSYGVQVLPDGSPMDPGNFNHYLGVKGARSGCNILWGPAAQAVGYSLRRPIDWPGSPLSIRLQHIDDALAAGDLPIVKVQSKYGPHYVVIYEKAPNLPDGSPDYLIVDPARYTPDHSGKRLSETYGTVNQLAAVLQVIIVGNKAAQPGRVWSIVAHSPVQLLITDPSGKQTGFDPTAGTYVANIEGATYGLDQGLGDDSGEQPPLPDVLYFEQDTLSLGTYTVQVFGTGSGGYKLDLVVAGDNGEVETHSIVGTATPGSLDVFEVQVSENGIVVSSPNQSPTASDDEAATDEGVAVTIDVLANDSDPDGDTLTVTNLSDPTNGSVALEPDGTVTYTPDPGSVGQDSFTYTANDGTADSNTATVTVTIAAINHPPVGSDDVGQNTCPDSAVTVDVLTNDTDEDGDPLTVSNLSTPEHGTVTDNQDGTVTYTPDDGFVGDDTFTYVPDDGTGNGNETTVRITVVGCNQPPTATDDEATTDEDTSVVVDVLTNDADPDGDPLSVAAFDAASTEGGTISDSGDGTLTYTPPPGFVGSDSFGYTVSDGQGGTDDGSVTITVNAVNHPPVANDDAASTDEDAAVVIDVLSNDSDPDGDELVVSQAGSPANGTAVVNVDGTVTYSPNAGFSGTDGFGYTVTDGQGGTATATVTVAVNQTTTAPRGVGYWKTHADRTASLLPQTLGDYAVSISRDAAAVFKEMNCGSSKPSAAAGCLAGQLLAAKLNLAAGTDPCITQTVAQADALLRSIGYAGPSGAYKLSAEQRAEAIALKDALDIYNNGGGCG